MIMGWKQEKKKFNTYSFLLPSEIQTFHWDYGVSALLGCHWHRLYLKKRSAQHELLAPRWPEHEVQHYLILPSPRRSRGFQTVGQYSQHRPLMEGQWGFPNLSLTFGRKKKKSSHCISHNGMHFASKEGEKEFYAKSFSSNFCKSFTKPHITQQQSSLGLPAGVLRVLFIFLLSRGFGCAISVNTKLILAIYCHPAGYPALLKKVISHTSLFQIFPLNKQNNN